MQSIKLGVYKNYSGKLYQVLGIARHSETLEEQVVYMQLYGDYGMWVRPAQIFCKTITKDGVEKSRFKFLSNNLECAPTIFFQKAFPKAP